MKSLNIILLSPLLVLGCKSAPEAPPTKTCTVALIRHAEAFTNVGATDGMNEGQANQLTDKGKAQAARLSDELSGLGIERLISSPVGRAVNTSQVISEKNGWDGAIQDPNFRILDRGDDPDASVGSWAWRVERWKFGKDEVPPGGESLEMGTARAVEALNGYCSQFDRFGVVTHSDIIAGIRASHAGVPIHTSHESLVIEPATFTILNLEIPVP